MVSHKPFGLRAPQLLGDLFMDVNDELGMSLISKDQAIRGD
jgi:hypothetical protein